MHGKKSEEAFHEPEGRARQSPARRLCIAKLRRARSDAPYRFMVPIPDRIGVSFPGIDLSSSSSSSSSIRGLVFEDEDEQEDDLVHGPNTCGKYPKAGFP